MPWTSTVNLDPDKPDIGTATSTWDAGGPDEYVYAARTQVSAQAAQQFKVDAEAARDAELARRVQNVNLAGVLDGIMNG
jgi:hypothetical protein